MPSKQTYTVQEATKKLEYYCTYQERCHQDVRKKLTDMQMIPEATDLIMVHLIEHNFLNEERFAKSFVSGKFKNKHWGKRRLAYELKKKEVSVLNIDQALKDISEEEYLEAFNSLAAKKAHSIQEANLQKKKNKFLDYFLYRGWESHLVFEKANELIK